jgi:S1-C subfamily serine protease
MSSLVRFSEALAELSAVAQASVVRVRVGERCGAGVVVAPGRVVTCLHVVGNAETAMLDCGRSSSPGRVLDRDARNDLALVAGGGGCRIAVMQGPARVGEVAVVIGAPGGKAGFVTSGTVARVGIEARVDNGVRLSGAFEMDVRVAPGNSGGAVIGADGRLIGILAAGRADFSVGVGVPVERVLALLNRNPAAVPAAVAPAPQVMETEDLLAVMRAVFAERERR